MISCALAGDFSPVLPLNIEDLLWIEAFQQKQLERENETILMLADIHWFLRRLAIVFTGDEQWNTMPSTIAEMTKNYLERKKLWEQE